MALSFAANALALAAILAFFNLSAASAFSAFFFAAAFLAALALRLRALFFLLARREVLFFFDKAASFNLISFLRRLSGNLAIFALHFLGSRHTATFFLGFTHLGCLG